MRRRQFLTVSAGAVSAMVLYVVARESGLLVRDDGTIDVPLRFFTAKEARTVSTACETIFPRDAHGSGATDAGVVIYIDRQLAGPYGRDKYRYTKPPFLTSVAEHGYQGEQNPRQMYRAGIRELGTFDELSSDAQISKLTEIENTSFFQLLRRHTIEGMFCDPVHGGNADLVGWTLIGYPGPQFNYRDAIDRHFGEPWRPKAGSMERLMGRVPPLLEDEKD